MPSDVPLIKSTDLLTYEPAPGAKLHMFVGADHGLEMCFIIAEYPPGTETPAQRHPTGSVITVCAGHGVFRVEDDEVKAGPGDIIVVPGKAWHSFRNDCDEPLRIVGADQGAYPDAEIAS